ncbi:carboxypeptidase regulatory-like domain-containing protein, partial [bacterium]|nr:carboxypeptidase regulatory-like domain-containing protein [bacterium]
MRHLWILFLAFLFPNLLFASPLIYSTNGTWLKKNVHVVDGSLSSSGDIIVGAFNTVDEHLLANNDVLIQRESHILGNVEYDGTLIVKPAVIIDGARINPASGDFAQNIPTQTYQAGGTSFTVAAGLTQNLSPGSYTDVLVQKNGQLHLTGGTYHINRLRLNTGARLIIDAESTLIIGDTFQFLQNSRVILAPSVLPHQFVIYQTRTRDPYFNYTSINQAINYLNQLVLTNYSYLGNNVIFKGTIFSAYDLIALNSGVQFEGHIEAQEVIVGANSTLTYAEPPCIPADEICGDGIDQDCNGSDLACPPADSDGDGFSPNDGDCDDANSEIYPGASEVCDELDNDCDAQIDEDAVDASYFYVDGDQDGYGDDLQVVSACNAPAGTVLNGDDCNDYDAQINPLVLENCDAVDNNCDGNVDEGVERCVEGVVVPPEPEEVAPPLEETIPVSAVEETEFLYTGTNPIQTDVAVETIDPSLVSVVRGKVLDAQGNPLAGVTVTIHEKPEFGSTLSRLSGQFDLALNGGGWIVVNFNKDGYLPVQRKIQVTWRDIATLPDVMMMEVDPHMSVVDLSSLTETFVFQSEP